jgi:NAD-dependent dihydropyrimidine dehydrogenase PreA subunit
MSQRWLPAVDEMRCTSNGACVQTCPTACLGLRAGLPVLARPHECVSCELCAAVCPVDAIRMETRWDLAG